MFLTKSDQKELAKAYLIFQLDHLAEQKKDILTINAKKAGATISGLTENEVEEIIKQGLQEGWIIETQELILDKIAKGKDMLKEEVTIDE